jgi:hypothetical protein
MQGGAWFGRLKRTPNRNGFPPCCAVAGASRWSGVALNPVQMIQSQLLSVLLDAVRGTPPALQPGAEVQARLVALQPGGQATLQLAGQHLAATLSFATPPSLPLAPGQMLRMRVEVAGPQPTLLLLDNADGSRAGLGPRGSGVAGVLPAGVPGPAAVAGLPAAVPPSAPAAGPLQALQGRAAARQAGLAPLFADAAAVAARLGPPWPEPLVAAARALLATRLDGEQPVTAATLKAAMATAAALPDAGAMDLKQALAAVRSAALAVPGAQSAPTQLPLTPPEPPRRDGAPSPQRDSGGTLTGAMTLAEGASLIASQADGALERQTLFRLASLPGEESTARGEAGTRQPERNTLLLEVPLALAGRTSIAEMQVERDAPARPFEKAQQWRLRFSVDTDRTGPLHASVGISGRSVAITVWAEEAAVAAELGAALGELEDALVAAELELAGLQLLHGKPPRQPATPERSFGYFLDRAS